MHVPQEESSFCSGDWPQMTLSRELLCVVHGSRHLPPSAREMLVVNHTYLTGTCACFTAAESEVHRAKYPTNSGSRGQIFPEGFCWKEIPDRILAMGFSWGGHVCCCPMVLTPVSVCSQLEGSLVPQAVATLWDLHISTPPGHPECRNYCNLSLNP